jgi:hypothetical protein
MLFASASASANASANANANVHDEVTVDMCTQSTGRAFFIPFPKPYAKKCDVSKNANVGFTHADDKLR